MKKSTKIILITSACLMTAGALLTGAGLIAGGAPGYMITGSGLRTASSRNDMYQLKKTSVDRLTAVNITMDVSADIEILPSDDGNCYLEYLLDGDYPEPRWEVHDGTLTLTQEDSGISGGVFFFGSDFGRTLRQDPFIRVYVPEDISLSDLDIYNDAGSIEVRKIHSEKASLNADFGNLSISGCDFGSLELNDSSGGIEVTDTRSDTLISRNDFGDSSFSGMSVLSAEITSGGGSIYLDAENLENLTGSNDLGSTDIILHAPLSDFSCDISTDFGSISLPDNAPGNYVSDGFGEESYESSGTEEKKITFSAASGDIDIEEK